MGKGDTAQETEKAINIYKSFPIKLLQIGKEKINIPLLCQPKDMGRKFTREI